MLADRVGLTRTLARALWKRMGRSGPVAADQQLPTMRRRDLGDRVGQDGFRFSWPHPKRHNRPYASRPAGVVRG